MDTERSKKQLDAAFIRHLDLMASITTESIYVLDVVQEQFCYISPHAPFLCGHPAEEAMSSGYDFFRKIIYPEDLPLWQNMYDAILRYDGDQSKVDFFCCTFRLQQRYSFLEDPLPQMVFQRMKPIREDDELRYLLCSVSGSVVKKAGNLCLYHNDGLTFEEYQILSSRWMQSTIRRLTGREKAILMLAQQGKIAKEIADLLGSTYKTVDKQITGMYEKLNVHSMLGAYTYASNRFMLRGKKKQKKVGANLRVRPIRVVF